MSTTTSVLSEKTKIGWVGTGVMGRWMCQHVMDLGYQMTVYNRTKAKADPLVDDGATWADSPQAVAKNSDVIFITPQYSLWWASSGTNISVRILPKRTSRCYNQSIL